MKMLSDYADADLVTPGELARALGVNPKTVTRWGVTGRLPTAVRTLGGHRRYRISDVRAVLDNLGGK